MILICWSKRRKGVTEGRRLLLPLCCAKWLWDSLRFPIMAPLSLLLPIRTMEGNWSFPKIRMTPLSSCWWNVGWESLGMVMGCGSRLGFYSAGSTLGKIRHTGYWYTPFSSQGTVHQSTRKASKRSFLRERRVHFLFPWVWKHKFKS